LQGLYKGERKQNLDEMTKAFPTTPARVMGPFALTYNAQVRLRRSAVSDTDHFFTKVRLDSLIIINLVLAGVSTQGAPATMVHEFLKSFFKDDGLLIYEEIIFNIEDEDGAETHAATMAKLADKLSRSVNVHDDFIVQLTIAV